MTFNRELLQILCPYGEWPHSQGMQIVDEEAASRMKSAAKYSAAFTRGIPIYIGHPDEGGSGKKIRTVGRIKKICATEGGIAVLANYDEGTFRKIESGKLKAMSPRWQMEKLENGKYRPVRLISAGLTNNPNIPESGKIICATNARREKAVGDMTARVKNIARKYGDTLGKLKTCAQKASEIGRSLGDTAVADRIAALHVNSAGPKSREKSVREIGMRALERSRRTGEPYTKSFAAVRRELA